MTLLVLGLSSWKSQPIHFYRMYAVQSLTVCFQMSSQIVSGCICLSFLHCEFSQPTQLFRVFYVCGPTFACAPILMKPTETFNSNQYSCSRGGDMHTYIQYLPTCLHTYIHFLPTYIHHVHNVNCTQFYLRLTMCTEDANWGVIAKLFFNNYIRCNANIQP